MNIGIMGGTFDPLHLGHLLVAEQAREQMSLNEVWFMPSNQSPHKDIQPKADPLHRLEMVRLAIADHPKFKLCELEFERGGTSYSVETAYILKERYPQHQFHWIIGADMVQYLPQWFKIQEMISLVSFIGLDRPGYEDVRRDLPDWLSKSLAMIKMVQFDISSTEIRNRIANGQSVRYMLTEPIRSYIQENQLYGT
ncbi:MAG: nicotinate-nucleotide adenylyltransferase [Paenibacillaceae bacterium]